MVIPPTGKQGLASEPAWHWAVQTSRLYAAMLHNRVHFAEASYGDGEWHCILGHAGQTSNGQVYEPWLGEALRQTLFKPRGQWCSYWGSEEKGFRSECDAWLRKHDPPAFWISRRAISAANVRGEMAPVFNAIRNRKAVLIGPDHLNDLDTGLLGEVPTVTVSENRAYDEIDRVCATVMEMASDYDLFLFSTGLAAAVMIWTLQADLLCRATLWDVGAIWDPYCGVYSRKNYAKKEWQENVMPRNYP